MVCDMHNDVDAIGAAEAADILHVDRSTLTRKVKRGDITPIGKLAGPTGALIFDRAYIESIAPRTPKREVAA